MVRIDSLDLEVQILIPSRRKGGTATPLGEWRDGRFTAWNAAYEERPHESPWEHYVDRSSAAIRGDPLGQDPTVVGRRPRTHRAQRYCGPAEVGQRFYLRFYVGPNFPFLDDLDELYIRVYIDGQRVENFAPGIVVLSQPEGHEHLIRDVRERLPDRLVRRRTMHFVRPEFRDIDDGEDPTGATEHNIGVVRVLLWRATNAGQGRTSRDGHPLQSANEMRLRERKMKRGELIGAGTGYGGGGRASRCGAPCSVRTYPDGGPSAAQRNPTDEELGHPIADIRLLYRNRRSLQIQGLIPRDPIPDGPDLREIKREEIERSHRITNALPREDSESPPPCDPMQPSEGIRQSWQDRFPQQRPNAGQQEPREDQADDSDDSVEMVSRSGPGNDKASAIDLLDDLPGDQPDLPIDVLDNDGDEDVAIPTVEDHRTSFERTNAEIRSRPRGMFSARGPQGFNGRAGVSDDRFSNHQHQNRRMGHRHGSSDSFRSQQTLAHQRTNAMQTALQRSIVSANQAQNRNRPAQTGNSSGWNDADESLFHESPTRNALTANSHPPAANPGIAAIRTGRAQRYSAADQRRIATGLPHDTVKISHLDPYGREAAYPYKPQHREETTPESTPAMDPSSSQVGVTQDGGIIIDGLSQVTPDDQPATQAGSNGASSINVDDMIEQTIHTLDDPSSHVSQSGHRVNLTEDANGEEEDVQVIFEKPQPRRTSGRKRRRGGN